MGYKLLGCGLLLVAGGYLALVLIRHERRRVRALDGFMSLVNYIKGQIDCYAMPIAEILARVDGSVLAACRGFSKEEAMRVGRAIAPVTSVSDLIQEGHPYLEPECERLLVAFSSELGGTFREEQVKRCDYYLEMLGNERSRLAESIPMRIRVNGVLCLCGTLGLLVLLW